AGGVAWRRHLPGDAAGRCRTHPPRGEALTARRGDAVRRRRPTALRSVRGVLGARLPRHRGPGDRPHRRVDQVVVESLPAEMLLMHLDRGGEIRPVAARAGEDVAELLALRTDPARI